MDVTQMMQAIPELNGERIFLLLEGGAQTTEAFQSFYDKYSSALHPLYLHPQLIEVRNYGPWLYAPEDTKALKNDIESIPGLVAVIASTRSAGALSVQLSAACTIIPPEGAAVLVRFYTRNVISLLASLNDREWHSLLFKDISQWWTLSEDKWQRIPLPPSKVINGRDSAIRLNKEEWQCISDKPVVAVVLAEWQKMRSSQYFPPCVQRDMVIKALNKASEAKMKPGAEQKLYALHYLNGGKKILESDVVQSALDNVVQGKLTLENVLTNNAYYQG